LIDRVKKTKDFQERVSILSAHFLSVLLQHEGSMQQVNIVSDLLKHCFQENDFSLSLESVAKKNKIALRTLQRYFETCTGISSKQALQVIRIRKAVAHIIKSPENFHYSQYGYYDHSHFYKNLKSFLQKTTLKNINVHLPILTALHK
jgi:methylphosphotriester-DNA--protein-cysteine methyltransferase